MQAACGPGARGAQHSGHQHPDHHRLRRRLCVVVVASISPLLDIHVILKKVTLLSNFTSIRYQQLCKERNAKLYLRISMNFKRKKKEELNKFVTT
jgi:hypothetical protein